MTDLQERLAKALGWKSERKPSCTDDGCLVCQSWLTPDDVHELAPAIDWRIVPVILAECKRRGWNVTWNIGTEAANMADIWMGSAYDSLAAGTTTDPVAALARAFCLAVETTVTQLTEIIEREGWEDPKGGRS